MCGRAPIPKAAGLTELRANERVSSKHDTKVEAVAEGRDRARKDHVGYFIQDQKGQIQSRNSYGGDPPRRKG